jgi:hypothetical protein
MTLHQKRGGRKSRPENALDEPSRKDTTMFRQSLTNRAARLLAITAVALGAVAGPAGAQYWVATPLNNGASRPLRASFTTMYCKEESNDNTWPVPDADEPYLLIFAADLRGPVPTSRAFMTQVFYDVDTGERRDQRVQFWPPAGGAAPISSENDYIFLMALMEADDLGLNASRPISHGARWSTCLAGT